MDSAGNLFIADSYNQRIREVNYSTGVITTVAGNGTGGSSGDGGQATAAEIHYPGGVVIDSAGDLFIADTYSNRVREVNHTTGVITTVAGSGTPGYSGDNGQATAAELNSPNQIALDSSGNLYIADSANSRIREVNLATGVITTVAGDGVFGSSGNGGQATAAGLAFPEGIALDSAGDQFIVDTNSNQIREVNIATGLITTVAGNGYASGNGAGGFSGDGGPATAAELSGPSAIALDAAGDLFIADSVNDRIREVNHATGIITTMAGNGIVGFSGDNGSATAAELDSPKGITVNSAGLLFIADSFNNRIREVNLATGTITTVAGNGTSGFSGDSGPATAAELDYPTAVALDSAGDLFIADSYNNRIREVNYATGAISTVAGNGTSGSSGDNGPATAAELNNPIGIAVDSTGDLFIADNSDRIREVIALAGVITTVAGNGIVGSSGDNGPATAAEINLPDGIALDSAGNLYIADTNNQRIREVAARSPVTVTVSPEVFHTPSVTSASTFENTQTSSGLVVTPNSQDTGFVTYFQITNISGGSLFQNDGVTPISPNQFISVTQGQQGLKFTPSLNSTVSGRFTVQESTSNSVAGLSGSTATATITVNTARTVHTPSVTSATTLENTQSSSGLVLTPNSQDTGFVTYFQITNISGGSLFQNDGVTPISPNQFITVAQGQQGLKFTPSLNSTTAGSFMVQASSSNTAAGLGGSTVTATISVTPVPTSSVSALGDRTSLTSFTVSWSGTPGSGGPAIASYNIYYSTDGSTLFTKWLTGTTNTSATFNLGTIGNTYGFTSQAIDAVGTIEPAHKTADTTVVMTTTPWQNPLSNHYDVIGDGGAIVPDDALLIIDYLSTSSTALPPTRPAGAPYYDVLGENDVVPQDALEIITYLSTPNPAVSPAVTSPAVTTDNVVRAGTASDALVKPAAVAPALTVEPGLPLTTQGGTLTLSPAVIAAGSGGTASLGGSLPYSGPVNSSPSPSSTDSGLAVNMGLPTSSENVPQVPVKSLAPFASPLTTSAVRAVAVDLLLADSRNWLSG